MSISTTHFVTMLRAKHLFLFNGIIRSDLVNRNEHLVLTIRSWNGQSGRINKNSLKILPLVLSLHVLWEAPSGTKIILGQPWDYLLFLDPVSYLLKPRTVNTSGSQLKDKLFISDRASGWIKAVGNLERFLISFQNRRKVFVAINTKSEKVNLHNHFK